MRLRLCRNYTCRFVYSCSPYAGLPAIRLVWCRLIGRSTPKLWLLIGLHAPHSPLAPVHAADCVDICPILILLTPSCFWITSLALFSYHRVSDIRSLISFLTTGSLTYFVRYYCFIISLAIENSPTQIVLFLSYLHNKSLLELLAIVLNT